MVVDLRWILEQLPVGVWAAKVPGGEVTYANPEFERILGKVAAPASGISDAPATYGICDLAGRPYTVDRLPFSRVVASGAPATVDDLVIHRSDGRKINVRAFAYPVRDAEGVLTHVIIAFLDISKELAAIAGREQLESRLAFAINHAPIALWAAEANGTVTLSEGAGLASMGVRSGELVGKNLFDLYRDHPSIAGYLRRGLAGESFSYTVQVGDATYDSWLTPVRDAAGRVTGVTGLSRDVTEIRRLQTNVIQNDRAIALGTLAASVAHEINNPLTYMLGHLDFLEESLSRIERSLQGLPESQHAALGELTLEMRRSLDPVQAGTRRIANITRELRSFSRPRTGESDRADARSVVRSVLKLVGKELEARAGLHLDLQETAPIRADASRLVQVVLNLLVNAMEAFSGEDSAAHRIWVRTGNEGDRVLIEVCDNGPGVPSEARERIFEPFVTAKEVGQGSGLGLFVCRNIVQGFSGQVTVDDRPGGGARFRVLLPAVAETVADETLPVSPRPPPEAASCRVLLIDDDADVTDALARQLSAAGYRVDVESNAARVMERLESGGGGIDLIFCDLMMRGLSGMDLRDLLAVRAPAELSKVVFMTGGAFTPRARNFRERHAEQCVDKPFDVVAEASRRLRARGAP